MNSIGKKLRECRLKRKMRQEDLAEQTGLSANYIGMLERGEKHPSLSTFIGILNALEASADVVLADELLAGYKIKTSLLSEKLDHLNREDRDCIYNVIEALLQNIS